MSLRGFVLRGADLSEARLRGVDLTSTDLTSTDLTGADLTGAKLSGSNATDARFERAVLRRVSFVGAKVAQEIAERAAKASGAPIRPEKFTPVVLAGAAVNAVAFDPRGEFLAVAVGNTVWVVEAETYTVLLVLRGHISSVMSVAFSPSGTRLATGSWDQTARVWDVAQGTPLATLHGHTDSVTCVAFSPDGRLLATSSDDGTVRLWDVDRAECLATLYAVGDAWVTFTPTGRYRMAGDLKGNFWHVVGLCRFEPGELDPYCDLRLRDDEPLLPAHPDPALPSSTPSPRR